MEVIKQLTELKPHKINVDIYGIENVDKDLVESIKTNGILEPLVIKMDGTIISGHRRWLAAKELNLKQVPCRTTSFNTQLDEEEALIEFNRQRIKTFSQTMKEAVHLKRIESEKAELRKFLELNNVKEKIVVPLNSGEREINIKSQNKHENETNTIVAEKLGMKRDSFTKATKIWNDAQAGKEKAIEQVKKLDEKTITINKAVTEIKKEEKQQARSEQFKNEPILPTGKFNVIYADPPWKYANSGFEMSAANQYPLMSTEDIMAMNIPNTENDAIIFMWATNPLLEDALKVMKAWGFNYKTNIVWTKDRHTAGFYVFGQHELILIGVKGSMLPIGDKPTSIVTGKNDVHSKKPESVYNLIEKMYPNQKYIEMFARNTHSGWTSWGNQV